MQRLRALVQPGSGAYEAKHGCSIPDAYALYNAYSERLRRLGQEQDYVPFGSRREFAKRDEVAETLEKASRDPETLEKASRDPETLEKARYVGK